MNERLLSLLGIAKKGRNLLEGNDAVLDSIHRRRSYLILFASDYSDENKKKIDRAARAEGIRTVKVDETMKDIEKVVSKKVGVLGIREKGLAQLIYSQATMYQGRNNL